MPLQRSGVLFLAATNFGGSHRSLRRETQQSRRGTPTPPYALVLCEDTEIVRPLRDGLNSTVPGRVAKIV